MWYACLYIHKYHSAIKNEEILPFATWIKPGGHYARWKKPNTKGYIPHDLSDMWNCKRSNSQKQKAEQWLPKDRRQRKRGNTGQTVQASSCTMTKFWGSDISRWPRLIVQYCLLDIFYDNIVSVLKHNYPEHGGECVNFSVIIISQHIFTMNGYDFINYISTKLEKEDDMSMIWPEKKRPHNQEMKH